MVVVNWIVFLLISLFNNGWYFFLYLEYGLIEKLSIFLIFVIKLVWFIIFVLLEIIFNKVEILLGDKVGIIIFWIVSCFVNLFIFWLFMIGCSISIFLFFLLSGIVESIIFLDIWVRLL